MADIIPDIDNKMDLAIGSLLSKADPTSKTVISAYDSSKDLSANRSVISGPRFNVATLDTCATFLGIAIQSPEGHRIYTNKPSLANRIILEIQSLFPAICADCNEEYAVKFDSTSKPALRCFLCLQGCHDCASFTAKLHESSESLPPGTVWLCKTCHIVNNPIKPKKSSAKSKPSSKVPSKATSGVATPQQQTKSSLNTEQLSEALQKVSEQQQNHQQSSGQSQSSPSQLAGQDCPHGIELTDICP